MRTEDTLITMKDVAELCAVDIATVKWWVRSRQIPFVKLGYRHIRFQRTAVLKWIDSRKMEQPNISVYG